MRRGLSPSLEESNGYRESRSGQAAEDGRHGRCADRLRARPPEQVREDELVGGQRSDRAGHLLQLDRIVILDSHCFPLGKGKAPASYAGAFMWMGVLPAPAEGLGGLNRAQVRGRARRQPAIQMT